MSDSKIIVEPNGAGINNTIGRAELVQLLLHSPTNIHTLPQTASAHFTNSEILYPEKHRHHVERRCCKDNLKPRP
eukprot:1120626-Pelagomonas_calceolata.AAC.1